MAALRRAAVPGTRGNEGAVGKDEECKPWVGTLFVFAYCTCDRQSQSQVSLISFSFF